MLTNCTITDKDGKVTDYIWDDQKKQMVEGKREKEIPWWKLHQIAEDLGGEDFRKLYIQDSNGRKYKRIVIEYEEEEKE